MKDQGDGASGTDRREWSRARSTVINPRNRGTSEEPPVTEGINPKSRGDEWKASHRIQNGWEDGPGYSSLEASCRGPVGGRWWRDLQEGYQNRDMKARLCTIQPGPRPV